jgi:REP element-mobilizing transposase RayT
VGRPSRNLNTDDRFHVINHGVDGQDLFSIDDDWFLFESLIGRVCDDYGFRLNAYALMSNHFHFLVDLTGCEDRSRVSEGIGVLQSTYARYFNDRTKRRGPLFEPRFLSFGVDGDTKTHRVVRYIHRNPLDICGPRALGTYRWSSLPVYLGRREPPRWLDCEVFMPQDPVSHLVDLAGCRVSDLLPLDALPPQRQVSVDAIEHAVDSAGKTALDTRARRTIVLMLALDLRASDIVELSQRFDLSTNHIRRSAQQARLRLQDEPSFDQLVHRLRQTIAFAQEW